MTTEDAPRSDPDCPRRLDERRATKRHRLQPDDPGIANPPGDGEDDDHVAQTRLQDRDYPDRDHDKGDRLLDIDNERYDPVGNPARIRRDQPEDDADCPGDQCRDHPNRQRDARPLDDSGQEIASETIGAEDVISSATEPDWRREP